MEETGVATLLYWVLGEREGIENLPQVYTKLHLLLESCPHVLILLRQTEEMRIHKGLLLLFSLLTAIPPLSVDEEKAENPVLTSLVDPLVRVIVHHDIAEMRTLGFSCYKLFLGIFNLEAKHGIFLHLLNCVKHSGLLGWTVIQLKDCLGQALASPSLSPLYQGPGLGRLTASLYRLEQGPESDLLMVSDSLLATINFSVFLLARDKE